MNSQKSLIRRFLPLIIVLAVLITVAAVATPTIAYYLRKANDVEDEYTPAGTDVPSFQLTANNKTMNNVFVTAEDEGYPVYVRAVIVVTWQNKDNGDISFEVPTLGKDYELTIGKKWERQELVSGSSVFYYYYYTEAVESGGETEILIDTCTLSNTNPPLDPYGNACVLNVQIIVQTVQAKGATDVGDIPAWKDAWGIGPSTWTK